MARISDTHAFADQMFSGNIALSSGAIAAATTAGDFKTTATINFVIDGVYGSKAATDNIPFTVGHQSLGNNESCLVVLTLDSAGSVFTFQGPKFKTQTQTVLLNGLTQSLTQYIDAGGSPSQSNPYPVTGRVAYTSAAFLPDIVTTTTKDTNGNIDPRNLPITQLQNLGITQPVSTVVPFGIIRIDSGASGSYSWNSSGVFSAALATAGQLTVTFYNIAQLPAYKVL